MNNQFTEEDIENAYIFYKKYLNKFSNKDKMWKMYSFINNHINIDEIESLEEFKKAFRKLQMQKLEIEGLHKFTGIVENMILSGHDISLGKAIELVRNNVRESNLIEVGSIHISNTLNYINEDIYATNN